MKKFFKWYNILFIGLLIFILVEPALAVEIETKVELVAKEGCEIVDGGELKELLQTILDYIRIAGIALAVILQIADYVKAIFGSNDDSMAKANKRFVTRLIAIGLLFLVPSLLNFVLSLFEISGSSTGTCGIY
ncbi:MAG: hypothetical protein IJ018_05775 [Bacilli bacterium]|nr:hypothetical protein [Bacilli bacterium]